MVKNPRYTERFARHVGQLCGSISNKAVAELKRLHDSTLRDLKRYMAEQVRRIIAVAWYGVHARRMCAQRAPSSCST